MDAEFIQNLGISIFILLLAVAAALFVYTGLCALMEKIRAVYRRRRTPGETDEIELYPGAFSLRRDSSLRRHFARRHEVQVVHRWHCAGKWVEKE